MAIFVRLIKTKTNTDELFELIKIQCNIIETKPLKQAVEFIVPEEVVRDFNKLYFECVEFLNGRSDEQGLEYLTYLNECFTAHRCLPLVERNPMVHLVEYHRVLMVLLNSLT